MVVAALARCATECALRPIQAGPGTGYLSFRWPIPARIRPDRKRSQSLLCPAPCRPADRKRDKAQAPVSALAGRDGRLLRAAFRYTSAYNWLSAAPEIRAARWSSLIRH